MPAPSKILTLGFSCLGHAFMHMFTAFYFVIVLSLESEWQAPYHELIELWTLGALLVGLAALPAGWLSDRWNPGAMMVVFFIGLGASAIAAGLVDTPSGMMAALSALGLCASIYHPVGIPWLVRNSDRHRGKVLGVNGIFGGLGAALAALIAGALIDSSGWRMAFIVPGLVSVAAGVALWLAMRRGLIVDNPAARQTQGSGSRADMLRVFMVLLCTMFFAGVIYQATQTALPKVFDLDRDNLMLSGEGVFGIGVLVAVVYTLGSLMQVAGGYLADRFALKRIYLAAFLVQVPLLWLLYAVSGLPLVLVAVLSVMLSAGVLPAENMLLARHTPARRHGLAFGVKFVVSFGAAPLAVALVALVQARAGDLQVLFLVLAAMAAVIFVVALVLPAEGAGKRLSPAPVSPNISRRRYPERKFARQSER